MTNEKIQVTSHVSRDFLQNAAYFSSLPKVIWEYVSNSLDSAKDGSLVNVIVEVRSKKLLSISDDGEGMSYEDLAHFFTMHGENIQRKKGKRVRGRFGTGKSAAFGIAKKLTLKSVKDGLENEVSLHHDAIKAAEAEGGKSFPVEEVVKNKAVNKKNGTTIEISDFMIKKLDIEKTIAYVEKHLARYRSKAKVVINDHVCDFKEPPSIHSVTVSSPKEIQEHIGEVTLIIKVAPYSLDKEERGVDILSQGLWHETTLADIETKEFADRLFGEVDVPLFENLEDDIPPFDNTRNNQLNRANPRVVVLLAWISQELDKARDEILKEERKKRKTEQAKRLKKEAEKLAKLLNDDFMEVLQELELARKITGKPKSGLQELVSDEGDILPGEGDEKSTLQEAGNPHGDGTSGNNEPDEGDEPREGGPDLIPGESSGSPKKPSGKGKRNRAGLFSIEFANHTEEGSRSKYERETHTIFINLDHPQVSNALRSGGGTLDSKHFLEITYEIAGVEYAQVLAFERLYQGEEVDTADALFGVGETIDRISRRIAEILN